ncbi:insertion element [Gordonia polyisoprenivorans VH2]|uniref:Insertion element n=1 Tax=Gordonia polyisoprenivorans (strain DSM 44266 / VH2) TaxID=1112204 RepID=H6MQY7_GORPV|nr:insertion element [Gordonia polyisoprenivorans VH2]
MAAGSKRYSAELKRDAVDMVAQLVAQGSAEWPAMRKTADLLGVTSAETVRQWVRKAPAADAEGASRADNEEIRRLKQEVAELKRANGILKAASVFFAAEIDRPHR